MESNIRPILWQKQRSEARLLPCYYCRAVWCMVCHYMITLYSVISYDALVISCKLPTAVVRTHTTTLFWLVFALIVLCFAFSPPQQLYHNTTQNTIIINNNNRTSATNITLETTETTQQQQPQKQQHNQQQQ